MRRWPALRAGGPARLSHRPPRRGARQLPRRRASFPRCAASSPSPPPRRGARRRCRGSRGRRGRAACRARSRPTRRCRWPRRRRRTPREPWIAARDLAVLTLLYGSGLRVAEALGLTGAALPLGEALAVTGKRNKTRIVPLLPPVQGGDRALSRALPLAGGEGRALVPRRARRPAERRDRPARGAQGAARARPVRSGPRRTRCATASPPICSAAAPICARCRSCSAMPACPRPRSTPRSTPPI